MNKSAILKVSVVIFLIIVTLFNFGCEEVETVNKTDNPILIGALLPLTGSGISTGQSMSWAITHAANLINNTRPLNDQITIVFENTNTDPETAMSKLQRFKSLGITFVIGPYSSAELEYIKPFADANNMVLISPSSVSISLAIEGDNVFRLATNDYKQANAVSAFIKKMNISNLCAVNRDDIWGNSLVSAVSEKSKSESFEISKQIKYPVNQSDFEQTAIDIEGHLNFLKTNNVPQKNTAVYLASFNEGVSLLSKSAQHENASSVLWIGTSAFALNSTILNNNSAFDFAVKTKLACPVYAPDENFKDKWQPVMDYLTSKMGRQPESYAFTAYDAVYVAYEAIKIMQSNKTISPANAVLAYTQGNDGITGSLKLDKYGDREQDNYQFWMLRNKGTNQWYLQYFYDSNSDRIITIID